MEEVVASLRCIEEHTYPAVQPINPNRYMPLASTHKCDYPRSTFFSILSGSTFAFGVSRLTRCLQLLDHLAVLVALVDGADLGGSSGHFFLSRFLDLTAITSIWLGLFISSTGISLRLFLLGDLGSSWLLGLSLYLLRWSNVRLDFGRVLRLTSLSWSVSSWRWGWCGLTQLGKEVVHTSLLFFDFLSGLLKEADLELVVNERDDHFVVQWDHVRRNVVIHLLHTLHEDEGAVGREAILASLGDGPSLVTRVGNRAVVGGNSLQLDLDVALHGSTKGVDELLSIGVNVDFVLDVVDVLVGTDPRGPGSEMWEVLLIDVVLLVGGSHEVERLRWNHGGDGLVRGLVEMIVDDLAKINNATLLDLNFGTLIQLDSGSVNESEVTDVVLATLVDDHELRLPEFFIVGNLIVVGFTLTNFENSTIALKRNLDILQLCRVDTFKP